MALREIIGAAVRRRMDKKQTAAHVIARVQAHIDQEERERLRDIAERELPSPHEGDFARYRIRPSEFAAWQEAWTRRKAQSLRGARCS